MHLERGPPTTDKVDAIFGFSILAIVEIAQKNRFYCALFIFLLEGLFAASRCECDHSQIDKILMLDRIRKKKDMTTNFGFISVILPSIMRIIFCFSL